jgi:membrane protein implicated in regulation of membrane protease activity
LALFDPSGETAWVPASVAFMFPPIAIGIAVTRHRLYEIDRLISRGLSWAVLSGLLLAVYAAAVLVIQTLLGGVIQGQTVAVAGSTLLAAALFQPLRRRVQVAVDHRFNRARYDAERTATDFAERLRDEVDLATVSGDIVGVVDTALRPTTIGVWIRRPGPTIP